MSNSTISKTAFFAVKPETVWAYLTEADKLGEWFHPARKDLAANTDYELYPAENDDGSAMIWGTVLEWQPPSKLVYTFIIPPFGDVSTTVTWELKDAHDGTKLTLTHDGVGDLEAGALDLLMALDTGWDEHIGSLRNVFNNDDATTDCHQE